MRRPFSNIIRDGTRWRFLVADRSRKPAKKMTNLPLERQKKCEEFSRGQKPCVPVSLPPRCIVSSSWPINSLVTWWAIFRRHCLTRRSTRNFVWSNQYDYVWEILYRCSLSLDNELLCNITFLRIQLKKKRCKLRYLLNVITSILLWIFYIALRIMWLYLHLQALEGQYFEVTKENTVYQIDKKLKFPIKIHSPVTISVRR